MANQTIVAVPPNIENPTVLRRYLSLIVERLDVVIGARANAEYVSQQELIAQANEVVAQLESAQSALQTAQDRLDNLITTEVEDLLANIDSIELKNSEQDTRLDNLNELVAVKGALLSFTVDGLGEPDIVQNFNISGVNSRISTGLYEFNLSQVTFESSDVLSNSVVSFSWNIAAAGTYEIKYISTATAGRFRIQVTQIGVGLYDLAVGDTIDCTIIMNVPGTSLPPNFG